jgi:hypothetical protein
MTTQTQVTLADLRTPAVDGNNYETTGFCPVCYCSKGGDAAEPNDYTEACLDSACRCHTECPTCGQQTVRPFKVGRASECATCYPANVNLRCACGAKTDNVNRDAKDKCPVCNTFSTDHAYYGGDEDHCYDCDIRFWSHR